MPYGMLGSPDGPKSGCSFRVDPCMCASHVALRGLTGRRLTSACQMSSAGNAVHDVPGRGPAVVLRGRGPCTGPGLGGPTGVLAMAGVWTATAAAHALAVTT